MRRSTFFVLAAVLPGMFGTIMMVAPGLMLGNSLVVPVGPSSAVVTQWAGFGTFTLAVITFLSRNDPGSAALRAVMWGNIVFHVLGMAFDTYDFSTGFMGTSGLVTGLVPHTLLASGFAYYLAGLEKHEPSRSP